MMRLLVHVEGPTEERFVNEILAPYLYQRSYSKVNARIMGLAHQRDKRGGVRGWPETKKSIVYHLQEDSDIASTTMVDYYGLPERTSNAWPGRATSNKVPVSDRAAHIENAICRDLQEELGGGFRASRFVPYVMLHEFEALLFSDCGKFADAIQRPELAPEFQAIVDAAGGPEAIDDAPDSAPSKRIEALFPGYSKPFLGTAAVRAIGLDKIRAACPHFDSWLTRLEKIPSAK